jgi:hypothetical protein
MCLGKEGEILTVCCSFVTEERVKMRIKAS